MRWLCDVLAWSGWAGIQGLASLIALASVGALALDYRRQNRDAARIPVRFEQEPIRRWVANAGERAVVTAFPRGGVVLHEVIFMEWRPGLTGAGGDERQARGQWDATSEPEVFDVTLKTLNSDFDPHGVKVGLIALRRTPLGMREVGYRAGVHPGDSTEEWRRWPLWRWPWWPRKRAGRWVPVTASDFDFSRRGPIVNPGGNVK